MTPWLNCRRSTGYNFQLCHLGSCVKVLTRGFQGFFSVLNGILYGGPVKISRNDVRTIEKQHRRHLCAFPGLQNLTYLRPSSGLRFLTDLQRSTAVFDQLMISIWRMSVEMKSSPQIGRKSLKLFATSDKLQHIFACRWKLLKPLRHPAPSRRTNDGSNCQTKLPIYAILLDAHRGRTRWSPSQMNWPSTKR